ncbi:MAG: hypothetical protein PHR16_10075 [Methylovulum sp.]|nr:hypothetical protein [Methylovulum sp.]
MRSTFRLPLVAFLVLLQLVAPLVHAHTGKMAFTLPATNAGKLHVPGLEMLVIAATDNSQYILSALDTPSEGAIFGVDTGIKQHQANNLNDADNSFYLHQKTLVFNAPISPFDTNFSPQTTVFISRPPVSSHTPRAPPAR